MKKLKHIKFFENFMFNETLLDDRPEPHRRLRDSVDFLGRRRLYPSPPMPPGRNKSPNLSDDLRHIIEYKGLPRRYGDSLYAGQNSNFQQILAKYARYGEGNTIFGSNLYSFLQNAGVRYLIGEGDTLFCFNGGKWRFEDKNHFLSLFNAIHKTDYLDVVIYE